MVKQRTWLMVRMSGKGRRFGGLARKSRRAKGAAYLKQWSVTVPVSNLLSLSSQFILFGCSVKMDLGPLNSFSLPAGIILSPVSWETFQEERVLCCGPVSPIGRHLQCKWIPQLPVLAVQVASPAPGQQYPTASRFPWYAPLDSFVVECLWWHTSPWIVFPGILEGRFPANSTRVAP